MATDDFFRARLDQMIDLRHPLAVLARRMPWSQIETALSPAFIRGEAYGTRASTIIAVDHAGRGFIHERRFGPGGVFAGETILCNGT